MSLSYRRDYRSYYLVTFILAFIIVGVSSLFFWESGMSLSLFMLTSLSWLMFFFLFPLWASGFLIFLLRKRGNSNIFIEFILLWFLFVIGSLIKAEFDELYTLASAPDTFELLSMTLSWAIVLYAIERIFYYSKLLLTSKLRTSQAKAEARRYQLNPHMLFNSINAISSLIHTDPEKADRVLHNLADLLRYSLDKSSHPLIPLGTEISIVEKYLEIEKARFGERLDIEITVAPDCLTLQIPPLLIQPLVENAIKHNNTTKQLKVSVSVHLHDGIAVISVADNGIGFKSPNKQEVRISGVGLKNIEAQISNLKNAKIQYSDQSVELGKGACVTVSFAT